MYVCVCVCMYVCVYVCMYVCVYVCTYVCVCVLQCLNDVFLIAVSTYGSSLLNQTVRHITNFMPIREARSCNFDWIACRKTELPIKVTILM